jgi:hypothetical protein
VIVDFEKNTIGFGASDVSAVTSLVEEEARKVMQSDGFSKPDALNMAYDKLGMKLFNIPGHELRRWHLDQLKGNGKAVEVAVVEKPKTYMKEHYVIKSPTTDDSVLRRDIKVGLAGVGVGEIGVLIFDSPVLAKRARSLLKKVVPSAMHWKPGKEGRFNYTSKLTGCTLRVKRYG